MAAWGLGFFEAPSSRTKTSSAATGCAAVMGRSVGNVPAALTLLPSSVYCIPSQGKGPRNWVPETRASFRKHDRRAGGFAFVLFFSNLCPVVKALGKHL